MTRKSSSIAVIIITPFSDQPLFPSRKMQNPSYLAVALLFSLLLNAYAAPNQQLSSRKM